MNPPIPDRVWAEGEDSAALYLECLAEVRACPPRSVDATRILLGRADLLQPLTLEEAYDEVTHALDGQSGVDAQIPADDPFIDEELALAALLMWSFLRQWIDGGAQAVLREAAKSESIIQVTAALPTVEAIMGRTSKDQGIHEAVEATLALGILNGVRAVAAGLVSSSGIISLIGDPRNLPFGNSMEELVEYYADNFAWRIVNPRLLRRMQVAANTPGMSILDALNAAEQTTIGRSAGYWRMVANAHTSRVYTYGALRGGYLAGRRGYRLYNPMDNRTTQVCRSLHGREFWIADAINLMEHAADGGHDGMVAAMPWLPPGTPVATMTNQELIAAGVMVPPFHGHCRTIIQTIY